MSSATLNKPATRTLDIAITRLVNAPRHEVFDAWVDREQLTRWWGAREGRRDFSTPHVEVDPTPGGKYRICIRSPRGKDYWSGGVYREVERGERLVCTHGWEHERGTPGAERLMTIEFSSAGTRGTRVSFRIAGFATEDSRDSEIEGWSECLDRLVRHFDDADRAAEDEREIRSLIGAWGKALERKDLDGLVAGYAPDVVLFDAIPPYRTEGVEGIRAAWAGCLPCFPETIRSEHRDISITIDGDVAFAHYLHHVDPVSEPTSEAGATWLRITEGYRRINGEWKSTHAHVSIPFNPIDGKAWYIRNPEELGDWRDSCGEGCCGSEG